MAAVVDPTFLSLKTSLVLCGGLKDRACKAKAHTQQEQCNIRREISTVSGEELQRQGVQRVN
jgi:hypothetical protein